MLRIRSDGTTLGLPFPGPRIPVPPFVNIASPGKATNYGRYWRSALSGDGQYAYLIATQRDMLLTPGAYEYGFGSNSDQLLSRMSVWRVRVDGSDFGVPVDNLATNTAAWPTTPKPPFVANPFNWTGDNTNRSPRGIACDGSGRVYVCDSGAINVYSPAGVCVRNIPVNDTLPPIQIDINRTTGEIYLLLCEKLIIRGNGATSQKVVLKKLKSFDNPEVMFRHEFMTGCSIGSPGSFMGFCPMFGVDSWSSPCRIWLMYNHPGIRIYNDTGNGLALFDDFAADVRADTSMEPGLVPGWHFGTGMACDSVRGHLYVSGLGGDSRFDMSTRTAKCDNVQFHINWSHFNSPMTCQNGLLYPIQYGGQCFRLDPDKFAKGVPRGILPTINTAGSEIPFSVVVKSKACTALPDGSMLVSAMTPSPGSQGRVMHLNSSGSPFATAASLAQYRVPSSIQADSRTNIYVAVSVSGNTYLQKFKYGASVPDWTESGMLNNGDMSCVCFNNTFATDMYGRSFIPKQPNRTIDVIDANGNRICNVGRYGNRDDNAMSPDGLAIALCAHVAVHHDKFLYVLDQGNVRLGEVKLGYAKTAIVGSAGPAGNIR